MRVSLARFKRSSAAPSSVHGPSCANCAVPLSVGQDWCLECGTAVPGRLGRGPGLRSSLGVVGVTLLLVTGAAAAAYAALSSDSNKQATKTTAGLFAQVPPDVAPTTIQPGAATGAPPASTPAPGAGSATTLPVAPKLPAATPTPTGPVTGAPKATAPKTTAAAPKAATTPTTTAAKPKKTATPTTTAAPATKSATILLDTDAASTYNPYGLPASSVNAPAKAIDGDPMTSWTYQLDPSAAGKTHIGLAINLKSPQLVRAIVVTTATPGMTVEFYGAKGPEPVSITDPAWIHLANRRHLKASTTVALKAQGKTFDYLLVWITHAPAGVTTGMLGLSELSVTT